MSVEYSRAFSLKGQAEITTLSLLFSNFLRYFIWITQNILPSKLQQSVMQGKKRVHP